MHGTPVILLVFRGHAAIRAFVQQEGHRRDLRKFLSPVDEDRPQKSLGATRRLSHPIFGQAWNRISFQ